MQPTQDQLNIMQLIENISSFYNHSWSVLTTVIAIFLAVAGIGVPAFQWFLQRRFVRLEEERLRSKITAEIERVSKQMRTIMNDSLESIRNSLSEEVEEKAKKLARDNAFAIGGVFHVQALLHSNENPRSGCD